MPVWPKSFYTFGLSLQTVATERKLGRRGGTLAAQRDSLAQLLPRLAATSYWKQAGIEARMTEAKFRTRVPLCTHEQLGPAIARMAQGKPDVLWPGTCNLYARSSGTSTGTARIIPVPETLLAHFRRAGGESLLYYTARVKHAGVFRGRHLLVGASAVLSPLTEQVPAAAFAGEMSGIAARHLPAWAEQHFYEPGAAAAQLPAGTAWSEAAVAHSAACDITLIAGVPPGVMLFGQLACEKMGAGNVRVTHLQQHWPNLECFVHTGALIAPYLEELHELFGPTTHFHEVYAATEGFLAAQDPEPHAGLRLMADMGIFFEFLALADFDAAQLEQLGPKAVPLAGVKPGVDYVLILTTPGGLARYVLGDVVRFISTDPPRLTYIGGTQRRLNVFGENVTEREATEALVGICRHRGWRIVNFHVAPLSSPEGIAKRQRGRHEWWIELRPGTVNTPTGPHLAIDLDAAIQSANEGYASRRQTGALDAPVVRLVMPGVFEHWLRFRGKWGGQYKMPRCRSDRSIADELASITHFAQD